MSGRELRKCALCGVWQSLSDTCHAQDARDMLYAIGDADCYGGWEKLLSDVGYAGISDSGEVHFDREGDYTRIAAVRKSGYVSCDCNGRTEAQCGGHPDCRAGTIEPCCDNPDGHWDLCACEILQPRPACPRCCPLLSLALSTALHCTKRSWTHWTSADRCLGLGLLLLPLWVAACFIILLRRRWLHC